MHTKTKWQMYTQGGFLGVGAITAPITVRSSIWIESGDGLVEFHSDSDTISPKMCYPISFTKERSAKSQPLIACKFKDESIVVIDGDRGIGIMFDTETRKYSDIFLFQGHFGGDSSCVVIKDCLHIFHGNDHGDYTIYSLADKSSYTFQDHFCAKAGQILYQVPVLQTDQSYKSSRKTLVCGFTRNKQNAGHIPSVIVGLISKFCTIELCKFGGWDYSWDQVSECVDSFYIGAWHNEDPLEPIQWTLAPEYALKRPFQGLRAFGYIQHGPFIVTFGGRFDDRFYSNRRGRYTALTDGIYILDLRKDCGWIRSPIKCPQKAEYCAVLDRAQRIHLQSRTHTNERRYIMQLNEIIKLK